MTNRLDALPFAPALELLEDRTAPATLNVSTVNDLVDPGDGFLSLREAIIAANTTPGPDTIELGKGFYHLFTLGTDEDVGQTGDLDVTDDLTIRGDSPEETSVNAQSIDRIFHVIGPDTNVTLDSFTLTRGHARPDANGNAHGGAVYSEGNLSVINCMIRDSAARAREILELNPAVVAVGGDAYGGAIYSIGNLFLDRTTISNNEAQGGSVSVVHATAKALGGHAFGGGIYSVVSQGRSVVIQNCGIIFNEAVAGSAGIENAATGTGGDGFGGGIYLRREGDGTNLLLNSTIAQNFVFGGSCVTNDGTTGFRTGGAGFGGGIAIDVIGGTLTPMTIINATIAQNQARPGVGQSPGAGLPPQAGPAGGGGVALFLPDGIPTVDCGNTIIAENLVQFVNTPHRDIHGTLHSLGHNLIGNGDGGSGFVNGTRGNQVGTDASRIDPVLWPPSDNGGRAATMAFIGKSPAIDAGDTDLAQGLATDQRGAGFARVVGRAVDIGAYEAQIGTSVNLNVTQNAPVSARVGKKITYVVTAVNLDDAFASGVQLELELPAGLQVSGASSLSGNPHVAGQFITLTIGEMAPGESVSFTVTTKVRRSGLFLSVAQVLGNQSDPDLADNVSYHLVVASNKVPQVAKGRAYDALLATLLDGLARQSKARAKFFQTVVP